MTPRSALHRLAPVAGARLVTLAVAALIVAAAPARAADVALVAGAGWSEFTVDNQVAPAFGTGWIDYADGSPLRFSFTVASGATALLTVVDAGFAGDTYALTDNGRSLGTTSSVRVGSTAGTPVYDFDAALADASFSRGSFSFAAGRHLVGGAIAQSVVDAAGGALNATNGAVRLSNVAVAAVPEPTNVVLLVGGLGAVALVRRRRVASAH